MFKLKLSIIIKFLACLVFLTAFMGCSSSQKHESTGQYIDDSVITTKVKAAIFDEKTLKTLQIKVETYKGVVQLSGFVDTPQAVEKAGEVAKGVKDVVSVKNDLIIK